MLKLTQRQGGESQRSDQTVHDLAFYRLSSKSRKTPVTGRNLGGVKMYEEKRIKTMGNCTAAAGGRPNIDQRPKCLHRYDNVTAW